MAFCLNARRILYTAAFCAVLTLVPSCFAGSKLLYNFYSAVGTFSESPLYRDAAGNLYGTTPLDGPNKHGTVFVLSQLPSGRWQNTTLHAFTGIGADYGPVDGLVADAAGNLYGATNGDVGEVFQLSPLSGGGWNYSVIYEFKNVKEDVLDPITTPVIDVAGNIYGASQSGGHSRGGGVYKLAPQPDGTWQESVIYSFSYLGSGGIPFPHTLALGPDGNLYGTLEYGGAQHVGSIYQLSPSPVGNWTETTLLSMSLKTQDSPRLAVGLAFDNAGNIVGTSYRGVTSGGSLFQLPHNPDGTWGPVVTIHNFSGGDGFAPVGDPVVDSANNIYGTTLEGGVYDLGVVYKFSPNIGGGWTGVLLHTFGSGSDGNRPFAGPILDSSGNVYGTTTKGGGAHGGTAWEITP